MDYIQSEIENCFKEDIFKVFAKNSQQMKIMHRSLDGIGVNYNKKQITKVKAYCKILDYFPKFSDEFLNSFLFNIEERRVFFNFCDSHSECFLERSTGVSGFNLSVKKDMTTGKITRSIYLKKDKMRTVLLNFEDNISYSKYFYVFSPSWVSFLSRMFGAPQHEHGLELSIKDFNAFATIYPQFSFKSVLKPSSMRFSFNDFFYNLSKHKPWNIEDEILLYFYNNNTYLRPITKGYGLLGDNRKIYIGAFSYKHSAFKNFITN